MKELLQSKRFRKNLRKWLFMYVGTLCILSSVITYSKYISDLNGAGKAKIAKFIVDVNYINQCADLESPSSCQTEASRPLDEYEFNFSVDTSQVEVAARITVTPLVAEEYEEYFPKDKMKIYEINESEEPKLIPNIIYDVKPSELKQRKFKVVLEHPVVSDDEINNNFTYNNVLEIGYSALQLD